VRLGRTRANHLHDPRRAAGALLGAYELQGSLALGREAVER